MSTEHAAMVPIPRLTPASQIEALLAPLDALGDACGPLNYEFVDDPMRLCEWVVVENQYLPEQAIGSELWRFATISDLVAYLKARAAGADHTEATRRAFWNDY